MADSQPYKFCRQCGNRFSKGKLTDHERKCKGNEERKLKDSFDFKAKKQETKIKPIEDNDRVKEMKETPKSTLEEELKQEIEIKTSGKIPLSPQKQMVNESELKKENKKDKDSTKYSSKDMFQGGTLLNHGNPTKAGDSKKTEKLPNHKTDNINKAKKTSSVKKAGSKTVGEKSDKSKDIKTYPNINKDSDDSNSTPSPRYSSRSCKCSKEFLSKKSNIKENYHIPEPSKDTLKDTKTFAHFSREKTEPNANNTRTQDQKSNSKFPKTKNDPITGKKKVYQSQDEDNQDNKAFPNPREVSKDSNSQLSPRYSSRSCECAKKYSTKNLNDPELEDEKNKLNAKLKQDEKPFPIMNKFDKTPDKKMVDSKEIAKKREELKKKDYEEVKEDALSKIDKQFLCKYCGQTLPAEDVPNHERLCERRPYKEHELKVENKL